VRGWGGGSIFRKTPDIGLASYRIIPIRIFAKEDFRVFEKNIAIFVKNVKMLSSLHSFLKRLFFKLETFRKSNVLR
jgi:hypothetical protein